MAGALAVVASSQAAITITSLQVRAGGTDHLRGPMGAGYDIRIVGERLERTWRATSWTTGGVTRCVDHSDRAAARSNGRSSLCVPEGDRLAETPLPRTSLPAPATRARVPAAARRCLAAEGRALHQRQLLRERPRHAIHHPQRRRSRNEHAAHRGVPGDQGRGRPGRVGIDRERGATKGQGCNEGSRPGPCRHRRQDGRLQVLDNGQSSPIAPYQNITQTFINGQLTTYLNNYNPGGPRTGTPDCPG